MGKRRLEEAVRLLQARRPGVEVDVHWRPFFLDPGLPREGVSKMERYNKKFGEDRVRQIILHMQRVGQQHNPPIRFSYGGLIANTLDSHRLIEHAAAHGKQDGVVEALFARYFEREANIGDRAVLLDAAVEAGLPRDATAAFLASDAGAAETRAAAADLVQRHNVSGVPHFIIGDRVQFSGAQEAPTIVDAFEHVLAAGASAS